MNGWGCGRWGRQILVAGLLAGSAMPLSGCDRLYYGAMKKVGLELTAVSHDVDALVTDMQQAIGEADAYLKAMEQAQAS